MPLTFRQLIAAACSLFLAACSTTPSSTNQAPEAASVATGQGVDIWFVPFDGFSKSRAEDLAKRFSNELKLHIRVSSPALPVEMTMFSESGQLMGDRVLPGLKAYSAKLPDGKSGTTFIGLAVHDMNSAGTGWRFTLALHDSERHSIVSMARVQNSFYGMLEDSEKTEARLYKMVKKTIGQQYYGRARSTDPKSIMFTPMSIDDLDAMSSSF